MKLQLLLNEIDWLAGEKGKPAQAVPAKKQNVPVRVMLCRCRGRARQRCAFVCRPSSDVCFYACPLPVFLDHTPITSRRRTSFTGASTRINRSPAGE